VNHRGHCFPVLFCLLNIEIVCSALLNANWEAGLGRVCHRLVDKVGGCRRVLLVPECYVDKILCCANRGVDISVSENKEVKLSYVILLASLDVIDEAAWGVLIVAVAKNCREYNSRQDNYKR